MDHGQQEDLTQKPFSDLARQLERRPLLAAALDRSALGGESEPPLVVSLPGLTAEDLAEGPSYVDRIIAKARLDQVAAMNAVTEEARAAIIHRAPEGDRQPPPAGLLGQALRRVAGEGGPFRARLERELMRRGSCSVCHEVTCRQTHEVVFEGMSYWCSECGYCEPDSTHDACSGTLRRVRVTARADEPF